MAVLGEEDFVLCGEAAVCGAGWLQEYLPVAAGGFVFIAGVAADQLCGFRGADGFGFATVGGAFGKELEDGGFEGGVFFAGVVAAASFAVELEDVPVLLVLLLPLDGAAAGLAELVFVRGGVGRSGLGLRSGIGLE